MECFTSAEALLEDAPKTIEVRGVIKWLSQAKGSLSQAGEFDSIEAVRKHLGADENVQQLEGLVPLGSTTPFSEEDTEKVFNGEQSERGSEGQAEEVTNSPDIEEESKE